MDTELKDAFLKMAMRMKRVDICFLQGSDFGPSELMVMGKLAAMGDCGTENAQVSDIQRALYISKPMVSQTLNSLEKQGYITRAIDPQDRRKVTVMATSLGQEAFADALCDCDTALSGVLSQFGEENTKALLHLVDKLLSLMQEKECESMPQPSKTTTERKNTI